MNEPEWDAYLEQFNLDASYFQKITNKTNKYCVIVEPRVHEKLIPVVRNFMYLLQSKGWGLIIFHGTKNEEYIKTGLKNWSSTIKYISLGIENLTPYEYSDLLCSPNFWGTLIDNGCEYSFIFQTDTVLLKDNIDDFLKYDYIGAPWCRKWLGLLEVGNGGLSLRNVNKMYTIAETYPRISNNHYLECEDIYFSYWLLQEDANVPTIEVAKTFAVETIFSEDTCGIHQPHIENFPNRNCFVKLLEKRWL
jgi:hypothetical protein